MPFITDKLEALKEQNKESKATPNASEPQVSNPSDKGYGFRSRFDFSIKSVMQQLRANIIGQDKVLGQIEQMLQIIKAELSDSQKPLGVALLLGPTGVGKTSTARLLAKAISGNENNLCRIDMNTLSQEHYAASLIGAPPGYVGSKEGNTMFDANLIAGSYSTPSVVLFDELEKASNEVLIALLDVLDSGELRLTSGVKTINFRNSIILMTSNLGVKELFSYQQKSKKCSPQKEQKIIQKALEKKFLPEFINRIDSVIYYQSIPKQQLLDIIDLEIKLLQERTSHTIILSDDVKNSLMEQYDIRYGVRDVKRLLLHHIFPLVAQRVLESKTQSIIHKNKGKFLVQDDKNE
ncbi:ATP-dependent Clp protease ATP-binding subunit [Helicobacter aurati]|uniref:Chaperone protein ClpB n=1 Tax=Helicobacter aurati TaxID=137778 RepID=A0A3D8J284_9HELI|nr:AAA family ATPase [Helicobacter aurati]RDU71350.1 ATP-dependent Clp protease ATP-binding subunit [Helicobacter aurati]